MMVDGNTAGKHNRLTLARHCTTPPSTSHYANKTHLVILHTERTEAKSGYNATLKISNATRMILFLYIFCSQNKKAPPQRSLQSPQQSTLLSDNPSNQQPIVLPPHPPPTPQTEITSPTTKQRITSKRLHPE